MNLYFRTLINGGAPLRTIQRLKAKCNETLSNFALKFNLSGYKEGTLVKELKGRGFHSTTCQLNVSTFCGIRWVPSVATTGNAAAYNKKMPTDPAQTPHLTSYKPSRN